VDESDLSVLRERAESGDRDAVDQLIEIAGEQGNRSMQSEVALCR